MKYAYSYNLSRSLSCANLISWWWKHVCIFNYKIFIFKVNRPKSCRNHPNRLIKSVNVQSHPQLIYCVKLSNFNLISSWWITTQSRMRMRKSQYSNIKEILAIFLYLLASQSSNPVPIPPSTRVFSAILLLADDALHVLPSSKKWDHKWLHLA